MYILKPEDLSPLERFKLWKKRNRYSYKKIAEIYKVKRAQVGLWDSGLVPPPDVTLTKLRMGEVCTVYRWRHGMTQLELSDILGVQPPYISVLEMNPKYENAQLLVDYWTDRLK